MGWKNTRFSLSIIDSANQIFFYRSLFLLSIEENSVFHKLQWSTRCGKIVGMEELKKIIAKNLVTYRKQAHLTQAELAEKLGYSDKNVSKWERAEGVPDVLVLHQLAELYGVTVNDFFVDHTIVPSQVVDEPAPELETQPQKHKSKHHNVDKAIIAVLSVLLAVAVGVITWLLIR